MRVVFVGADQLSNIVADHVDVYDAADHHHEEVNGQSLSTKVALDVIMKARKTPVVVLVVVVVSFGCQLASQATGRVSGANLMLLLLLLLLSNLSWNLI